MKFTRGNNISKSLDLGQYRKIYLENLNLDNLSQGYYLARDEDKDYFVFKIDESRMIRRSKYSFKYSDFIPGMNIEVSTHFAFSTKNFFQEICCKILWIQKIKNYKCNLI